MEDYVEMEKYVGTKIIYARPMTLGQYNNYRGWNIPKNEDPNTEGYLVEYTDGGKSNHPMHPGYISWSPKNVFEQAYRKIPDGVTFGIAIEAMLHGIKIQRLGWNGKGMYLYYVPEGRYPPSTKAGRDIAAEQNDGKIPYLPYIAMKTVQGEVVPWLASQTDILATDWIIIP